MTLNFGGILLALCAVVTAEPFLEDFSLYSGTMDALDAYCSATAPFVRWLPMDYPEIEKVSFELRTPCKRIAYPVEDAIKIHNAPEFDPTKKTIVYMSGWNSDMNETYNEDLTTAVLCRAENNFIKVDTYTFLTTEYVNSAYNTGKLGEFVALGLQNLNINPADIHLVGHSLGAQVAGSAARHYATLTGKKIARVTGLDPANPCFANPPVFPRLTHTDAIFVDIVHSNPDETGTEEALGHADYFPNGLNPTQPGCFPVDLVCSHLRSIDYFTETVYPGNEHNFMAVPCADYDELSDKKCAGATQVPMGYAANENNKGIFFQRVNRQAPFGNNASSDGHLNLYECGVCKH